MDTFKRGRSAYYIETNHREADLPILLSGKGEFKARAITVDRTFIMIK